MVNDYSQENQSSRRKKNIFSSATSTSRGNRDSLLSVPVSSPLHRSNQKETNSAPGRLVAHASGDSGTFSGEIHSEHKLNNQKKKKKEKEKKRKKENLQNYVFCFSSESLCKI